MKKYLVVLVGIGLLVGFVGSAWASKPGVLTIWADEKRAPILREVKADFEAEYGIPVVIHEIVFGELKGKYLIAAPAGEGPDIIIGAHDWVGELAAAGLLEPVYLTAAERALFTPVGLEAFSWGGNLYGFPYIMEAVALFYNKDLIATPPATFEELIAVAKRLTDREAGKYGFLWDAGNFYFTFPLLSAQGGYVFKMKAGALDPCDIGLANAGAIAGGELLLRLVKEGIIFPGVDYGTMAGLFTAGNCAMVINGPWFISDVRGAKVNYGIAKIPVIAGQPPRPFVGVHGFMINGLSKNKALANEFLKEFVFTKKVQLAIWQADPRIPTYIPAFRDPKVAADPDMVAIGLSAADGIPMPNIPEMGAVWGAMGTALSHIIAEKLSPAAALAAAVAEIRAAIKCK